MEEIKNELEDFENKLKRYRFLEMQKRFILANRIKITKEDLEKYYYLLKDKKFLLAVLEYQPEIYIYCDIETKKNIEIASKAFISLIRINYLYECYIPNNILSNKQFIENIFKLMNNDNYQYYHKFIKEDVNNYYYIPYEFKNKKEVILTFLSGPNVKEIIKKIDYIFHDDYDILSQAIMYDPSCVEYASPRLKNDMKFMGQVFEKDFKLIRFASKRILEDIKYVIEAELFSRENNWISNID